MTGLWDTHLHTCWSSDSEADPADQVRAARAKGLSGVIFTDHLDYDYRDEPALFQLDVPRYLREMRAFASSVTDDSFTAAVGLELGLQPHLAARHRKLLQENAFDFVIGSVHVCLGSDPYYDYYYEGRSCHAAYLEYFECVLDNLHAFHDIDALGHLDYIVRYGRRVYGEAGGTPAAGEFSEIIDGILSFLVRHDIALEVNTGAYRCGMQEPNPSAAIIRRYHDLGGRLLTIGADAHCPEHVGLGFGRLPALLHAAGFDSYFVYRNRIPGEHPLGRA